MLPLDYRWAHAVNSQALLADVKQQIQKAKQDQWQGDAHVNAIEADIIWSEAQQCPVMGHPPQTDGDLPFDLFLHEMTRLADEFMASLANTKTTGDGGALSSLPVAPLIVKLDFKSMQAFQASIALLQPFIASFPYRDGIFINADILVGPATTNALAFDARVFLSDAHGLGINHGAGGGAHYHEKLVLSVGWTTSNSTAEEIMRCYSHEMVDEMMHILEPYAHMRVTFPVRATCARGSWSALQKLLQGPANYGLTLWWAATQMPEQEIEWLYTTLEQSQTYANRTFYDIGGFDSFLKKQI